MNETETIETINLTEDAQVDRAPVIESIPETKPESNIEYAILKDEVKEEADVPGVEDETLPDVQETEPDLAEKMTEALNTLEAKLEETLKRIDQLSAVVDNINKLEEARAAGPQGFFKPVGGDAPVRPSDALPRIEKIYK